MERGALIHAVSQKTERLRLKLDTQLKSDEN